MSIVDQVKTVVGLASNDSKDVVIYMKVTCPVDMLSELKSDIENNATIDEAVLVFPQDPVKWD